MDQPSGRPLGLLLGRLAVGGGMLFLGVGVACFLTGHPSEGVEGVVFGGLSLVAGAVILHRRRRPPDTDADQSPAANRPDAGS